MWDFLRDIPYRSPILIFLPRPITVDIINAISTFIDTKK